MVDVLRGLSPPTLTPDLGQAILSHDILSMNLSNLQWPGLENIQPTIPHTNKPQQP